jgi:hypothetical protein
MKLTLRATGLIGFLLFSLLFIVTFANQSAIEDSAKTFIQYKIASEVRENYQSLTHSSTAENAIKIAEKLGYKEAQLRNALDNQLPMKIAEVIGSMCGYDCEKKKLIEKSITTGLVDRLKRINIANKQLDQIIRDKYIEIVGNLKQDLRIFLGANSIVFLALITISLFKPRAIQHLFLPGMLLVTSTVISSAIYIFGQDWFYTIIYNDYMGFAYTGYLSIIFALLMDIVFNYGRITTEIINTLLNAIGSAVSLIPC